MADAKREAPREAWITGIGIVSCLGEGPDAHWQALGQAPAAAPTRRAYAPYIIHKLAPLDFDKQIPKKGDQRQMEAWQRIGTYAAGLALELRRRQRQRRNPGAHRHDRRGRRRRARHRRRHRDPVRPARRREAGGLPQRAADERSAADAVPRAAVQSPGRQHLDRPRRHRLLAHLHGRGIRGRRRGPHRAVAHRGRPERHRAGRRQPQCRAARPADALRVRRLRLEGQVRAGLAARGQSGAWRSARSAHSW